MFAHLQATHQPEQAQESHSWENAFSCRSHSDQSDMHGIHSYLMNDKTKSVGWHANIPQTLGFACDAF